MLFINLSYFFCFFVITITATILNFDIFIINYIVILCFIYNFM